MEYGVRIAAKGQAHATSTPTLLIDITNERWALGNINWLQLTVAVGLILSRPAMVDT